MLLMIFGVSSFLYSLWLFFFLVAWRGYINTSWELIYINKVSKNEASKPKIWNLALLCCNNWCLKGWKVHGIPWSGKWVLLKISSVQSLSCVWLFATSRTAACQASLSITNSWPLLKLMSIESVMPSNHLILCLPLLLPPSIFPSIRVFSSESVLRIRWPKHWSFSFSISPSNEYSGLISFRMDWVDLLAVQGTLKSLLQHHNSKVPILQCSAFFLVQLSYPYLTTGKTIAWTSQTNVGKVMSLFFNKLSWI